MLNRLILMFLLSSLIGQLAMADELTTAKFSDRANCKNVLSCPNAPCRASMISGSYNHDYEH